MNWKKVATGILLIGFGIILCTYDLLVNLIDPDQADILSRFLVRHGLTPGFAPLFYFLAAAYGVYLLIQELEERRKKSNG